MGLKVLIADDEGFVRRGIIASLPWEEIGVSQILEAEDGQQTLALARSEHPDIIVSDIRMPKLSGIELVDQLGENPGCKVIFMSAYSDKEYLKSAIRFHVVDYVEKPIDPAEMLSALRRASMELSEARKSAPYSPQALLSETLFFGARDRGRYFAPYGAFVLFIARSRDAAYPQLPALKQGELVTLTNEGTLIGLLYAPSDNRFLAQALTLLLNALTDTGCFVAYSQTYSSYPAATQSYQALKAMKAQIFWTGYGHSLMSVSRKEHPFDGEALLGSFRRALARLTEAESRYTLQTVFEFLRKERPQDNGQLRFFFYQTYLCIDEQAKAMCCRLDHSDMLKHLSQVQTIFEVEELLFAALGTLFEAIHSISSGALLASKIDLVIRQSFQDPTLDIAFICGKVFSGRSTVCGVYKKEKGKTLGEAILECRIKEACRLLQNQSYHLSQIAESTGFTDHNYFTKTFKKMMGRTPSAYRKELFQ